MNHEIALTVAEFKLFQNFMYEGAGINIPDKKQSLVSNRLHRRLGELKLRSYREYYEYITDPRHSAERQEVINALTTNETFFFRHKHHWDFISETLIPAWQKTALPTAVFHAWSAASSTGEEPYSLAILLAYYFNNTKWQGVVEATDINQEVLNTAQRGVYGEYALQKATERTIKLYFDRLGAEYRVKPLIKQMVKYRWHNLLRPIETKISYEMIMLRNVLIYFDDQSKKTVMENITAKLKSGGYLFVGGSETLAACTHAYETVRPTIYRKK